MANNKATVRKKPKKANKTFNLVNLPKKFRGSSKYTPNEKVLLNELIGQYYIARSYGNNESFYKPNDHFTQIMGVCENTFRKARERLVELKIIRYFKPAEDGDCTTYFIYPEQIEGWCDEHHNPPFEGVQNHQFEGVQIGGSKKSPNPQNINKFGGSNVGFKNGGSNESVLHPSENTEYDNENDDNAMTKYEMMLKIFAALDELRAENKALKEQIETLSKESSKRHNELVEYLKGGVQNGLRGVQNCDAKCTPYIYTSTDTVTDTTNNTTKDDDNIAHVREGLVGGGVLVGGDGGVTIQTGTPNTQPIETPASIGGAAPAPAGDGGVLVGVGGCVESTEDQTERQAQAMMCFDTIVTSVDRVIAQWRTDRDTTKAESNLQALCGELRKIQPILPCGHTAQLVVTLKSFKSEMMAAATPQQPTQTPQRYDNNAVYEVWAAVDNAASGWQVSTDPMRNQKADVQIGQALQRISQMKVDGKASEGQCNKATSKAKDYYTHQRGYEDIPAVEVLLRAMTIADSTPALSELFLTREQARVIKSSLEWAKRRQNASESPTEPIQADVAHAEIDAIRSEVCKAFHNLRNSPQESRRHVENAKARIRAILRDQDRWEHYDINYHAIAHVMVLELILTHDIQPLIAISDFVLRSGDDNLLCFLGELHGILTPYANAMDDDIRPRLTLLRLECVGKIKGCSSNADIDKATADEIEAELAA